MARCGVGSLGANAGPSHRSPPRSAASSVEICERAYTFWHSAHPHRMGDIRKRVGPHSLAAHVQRQSAASNDFAAAVVALDSVGCMRLGRLQVIRSLEAGCFYFRSGCGSNDSLRLAHFSFSLSFAMRMPSNNFVPATPVCAILFDLSEVPHDNR